jgi:SLT domain-containing protein
VKVLFDIFGKVADIVSKVASGIGGAVKWVGGLFGGGKDKDVNIPAFAQGGIVKQPQLALVGEDGPEAIIPLTKPKRAREILNQAGGLSDLISSSTTSKTPATFNFSPTININGTNSATIKEDVTNALSEAKRLFEKWLSDHQRQLARTGVY